MAEDGKIYITISDKPMESSGGNAPDPTPDKTQKVGKESNVLTDFALHQFRNLIQEQATNFVNYSINNIGNFTGDYNEQRHVRETMSIMQTAKGIALSAVAGFKYAGATGAIISTIATTASMGINAYMSYTGAMASNYRQNYSISQLKEISGLDQYSNGSR